ncbi:MAG: hypothetical protein K9M02_08655 [Thiohalocapsa sp.]|nr:hypothetical protein [Thiohalocapsa sp.]
MKTIQGEPSAEAIRTLNALRKAVQQKLDEKRRLGHYYVIWQDGRPVFIGDDAPDVGDAIDETAGTGGPP